MSDGLRYVVVSPVKNEQQHIERTIGSMLAQTVRPAEWIIVDDGSTDLTPTIVARYAERHSFIRLVRSDRQGGRGPGASVIEAFNRGRQMIGSERYDIIVKLDGDLSFPANYFEEITKRFSSNSRLGIASGIYLEADERGCWQPISMPPYHAFGACKVVRRRCFEEIGGFVAAGGWDTVDEIKALSRGWITTHFSDLKVRHHKREGSGIGLLRTSRMHGEMYYVSGGDPLMFVFKVMRRLAMPPRPLNAMSLTFGYFEALLRRQPKLVTAAEAAFYRKLLRSRLLNRFRQEVQSSAPQLR
jgi:glycosyltransferase involved in cell wall biosynthesis